MRSSSVRLICSFALFLAASAWADKVEQHVTADTPDKFAATAAEVRQEMASGGRYEFISPAEKVKANADIDEMTAMLQKSGSVAAMTQVEKVALFNAQENLNGILTHSDSNRLVCEHHTKVGTSIPQTECKTVGEIERARRATKDKMQEIGRDSSFCNNSHITGCRNN